MKVKGPQKVQCKSVWRNENLVKEALVGLFFVQVEPVNSKYSSKIRFVWFTNAL